MRRARLERKWFESALVEVVGQLSNEATSSRIARLHALLDEGLSRTNPPPVTVRQHQRRLRATEVTELISAYQTGATLRELADRYQVGGQTVSAILERAGIPWRYRRLSAADIENAAHLYRAGQSLAAIGHHFLVHPDTILHHLRRAGVAMRDCQGRVRS